MSFSPRIDRLERNSVINGAMEIWQRLLSRSGESTTQFTADRWAVMIQTPGTLLYINERVSDAPSSVFAQYSNQVEVQATQASQNQLEMNFRYIIEGYDLLPYVGNKAYVQFWAKSSVAGTYTFRLRNEGSDQIYMDEYTIDTPDTWEFKQILVDTIPTDNGTWNFTNGLGLRVDWMLARRANDQTTTFGVWSNTTDRVSANQVNLPDTLNATFQLTEVMIVPVDPGFSLEQVPNGMSFVRAGRNFKEELDLCMRYYQKSYRADEFPGVPAGTNQNGSVRENSTTNVLRKAVTLPVQMRALPTIDVRSPLNGTSGFVRNVDDGNEIAAGAHFSSENSFVVEVSAATSADRAHSFHWTVDAEIPN